MSIKRTVFNELHKPVIFPLRKTIIKRLDDLF